MHILFTPAICRLAVVAADGQSHSLLIQPDLDMGSLTIAAASSPIAFVTHTQGLQLFSSVDLHAVSNSAVAGGIA